MPEEYLSWPVATRGFTMAEESTEVSSMTVIGIGVVLFIIIVAIWYLFLK